MKRIMSISTLAIVIAMMTALSCTEEKPEPQPTAEAKPVVLWIDADKLHFALNTAFYEVFYLCRGGIYQLCNRGVFSQNSAMHDANRTSNIVRRVAGIVFGQNKVSTQKSRLLQSNLTHILCSYDNVWCMGQLQFAQFVQKHKSISAALM